MSMYTKTRAGGYKINILAGAWTSKTLFLSCIFPAAQWSRIAKKGQQFNDSKNIDFREKM